MASIAPRKGKDGQIISYQIKVSRGRDILTGKQVKPFTMTYTPPEGWSKRAIDRELQHVANEFEAKCKRGEVLTKEEIKAQALREAQKVTFDQYASIFMKDKALSYAAGTLDNYKRVLDKASPTFGAMRMEDITHLNIKQYLTEIQANGLAYSTVCRHYAQLKAFFESAVEAEVISINPMQRVKRPKPRKDEIKHESVAFDEKQVHYIMECMRNEPLKWRAVITFMLDSGCRRGEVMGLKWEEIDFQTGKVNICRNLQYTSATGVYISTPKSGKSRTIFLNPPALKVMAEWKREQAIYFMRRGIAQNSFCFTNDEGETMAPQAPTTYLRGFRKRYNIPDIRPHVLRHTMATLSIANGADVVSVSKKLGHADISTTLSTYAHANEEAQKRTNAILAEAIYN